MKPIQYKNSQYGTCAIITAEQMNELFTPAELEAGEKRHECATRGPWQIIASVKGLAVDEKTQTIYGMRTLDSARSMGYDMEGRVKVNGKRVRAFTSSLLFELPDKRLISCGILYLCMDQIR